MAEKKRSASTEVQQLITKKIEETLAREDLTLEELQVIDEQIRLAQRHG